MNYTLRKAGPEDKDFLLKLRIITMQGYLEEAGIFLDEKEHIARVDSHFDSSYIIESNNRDQIFFVKIYRKEKISGNSTISNSSGISEGRDWDKGSGKYVFKGSYTE